MSNLNKVLILILVIVGLGLIIGLTGTWLYNHDSEMIYYEGKEIFYSEEEYQGFKEFIAQKSIEIQDINVVASAPPILVDYELVIPALYGMPYNSEIRWMTPRGAYQEGACVVWGAGSVVGLIITGLVIGKFWG